MVVRGLEDNKKKMELKIDHLQNSLTELSAIKRRDIEEIEQRYLNLTESLKQELQEFRNNEEKYQKKVFTYFLTFCRFLFIVVLKKKKIG